MSGVIGNTSLGLYEGGEATKTVSAVATYEATEATASGKFVASVKKSSLPHVTK